MVKYFMSSQNYFLVTETSENKPECEISCHITLMQCNKWFYPRYLHCCSLGTGNSQSVKLAVGAPQPPSCYFNSCSSTVGYATPEKGSCKNL